MEGEGHLNIKSGTKRCLFNSDLSLCSQLLKMTYMFIEDNSGPDRSVHLWIYRVANRREAFYALRTYYLEKKTDN